MAPDTGRLGVASVLVPVAGGLVVGLMARFGSERIRGHGIPEAMETILLRGSRMEPRLAVLKPISSAVSIGSGGPFGAEGPIIVTGGAVGSIVGQLLHLTAAERRVPAGRRRGGRHDRGVRHPGGRRAAGRRAAAVRVAAALDDPGRAGAPCAARGGPRVARARRPADGRAAVPDGVARPALPGIGAGGRVRRRVLRVARWPG